MGVLENPAAVIHYTCPMGDCLVHVELEFGPDAPLSSGIIKRAKTNLREQIIAKHMAGEHARPKDPSQPKKHYPAPEHRAPARVR